VAWYRFYAVDQKGRRLGITDEGYCSDEAEAIERAKSLAKGRTIEVWNLSSRIAVVDTK
jgi:hypothetical protein